MDFSQVKAITIPEGNVLRILSGATVLWERTGLPAEYQEVEYLESTGTQYIDTNYTPNQNTKAYTKFNSNTLNSGLYSSSNKLTAYINTNGNWRFGSTTTRITLSIGVLYTSVQDKTGVIINETKVYNYDGTVTDFTSTATLRLMFNSTGFKGKIYEFKLYDNDILVRNFIPCYRKIDNVPGMYDLVNGVFYTNAGTGEFNVGADVIVLPADYQRVEYIQSSGTQYIRTPVPPSDNFRMDLKVYSTCVDSFYCAGLRIGGDIIFGQTGPTANNRVSASVSGTGVNASTDGVQWSRSSSGQTYEIMLRTNGDGTFTYHIEDLTNEKEFLAENRSYTLMGDVRYGICVSSLNSVYILNGTNQFYYFRLYKNGEVAFDGIPCYRKSDNVVGLYDLVSKTLLVNAGTGSFTAGPDV